MVADILGGALMVAGGGMLSASSLPISRMARQARDAAAFGTGIVTALHDTVEADIPPDMQALLAQLP